MEKRSKMPLVWGDGSSGSRGRQTEHHGGRGKEMSQVWKDPRCLHERRTGFYAQDPEVLDFPLGAL